MPDREEIVRSLYGAYWLARMDPRGVWLFNLSVEGFWHSFFAAIIVAPLYAVLAARELADFPDTLDPGWTVLIKTLAYALAWVAFPLAALALTRLLGLERYYAVLVIAGNWAAVLQAAGLLAAILVGLVLPEALAHLVLVAVTIAILFYQWFVTRAALQTTGGIALGLVMVDLLLNVAINTSADRLL